MRNAEYEVIRKLTSGMGLHGEPGEHNKKLYEFTDEEWICILVANDGPIR